MRNLIHRFNWKNFLQRTVLFFLVFLIVRIMVDWIEEDVSLNRVLQQSLLRYLIFGMILGLLDSDTWFRREADAKPEELQRFKSRRAALFHYIGVGFFISLLCGFILLLINGIRWLIGKISGAANNELFPDWRKYLLVIAIIGICFASYDAIRNYRAQKRQKEQA
jgi:hypothetical protein